MGFLIWNKQGEQTIQTYNPVPCVRGFLFKGRAGLLCLAREEQALRLLDHFDRVEESDAFFSVNDARIVAKATYITGRTSTFPLTATGRSTMLCMPRMAL